MNFSNSTHLATVLGGALVFLIALAVLPTVLQQFNQSKVMVGADGHCQYLGERFRSISYVKDDFQAALDLEDNSGDCALPSGTVLGAGDLYTPNGNIVPRGIGGGTTPVRQTGLNLTTSGIVGGWFILPSAAFQWSSSACNVVGFVPALVFTEVEVGSSSYTHTVSKSAFNADCVIQRADDAGTLTHATAQNFDYFPDTVISTTTSAVASNAAVLPAIFQWVGGVCTYTNGGITVTADDALYEVAGVIYYFTFRQTPGGATTCEISDADDSAAITVAAGTTMALTVFADMIGTDTTSDLAGGHLRFPSGSFTWDVPLSRCVVLGSSPQEVLDITATIDYSGTPRTHGINRATDITSTCWISQHSTGGSYTSIAAATVTYATTAQAAIAALSDALTWNARPAVLGQQPRLNETIIDMLPLVILVAGLLAAGGWIYNARRSSA